MKNADTPDEKPGYRQATEQIEKATVVYEQTVDRDIKLMAVIDAFNKE